MLYKLCYASGKRAIPTKVGVEYKEALLHIESGGVVKDDSGKIIKTKKELKDAEGIRSESGAKRDSGLSGNGKVSKASNSKLFGTSGDNSE